MAGGNNNAKQLIVEQGETLAADLQNGHAGDLKKIGNLSALTFKMLKPLYMNEFVTVEQCIKMHAASDKKRPMTNSSIKIGPVEVKAPVMALLNMVPTVILLFVLGKMQSWW